MSTKINWSPEIAAWKLLLEQLERIATALEKLVEQNESSTLRTSKSVD